MGEHPFVRHETVVYYAAAVFQSNAALERELAAGRLQLQEPVSAELLARIRRGAMDSPHTPFKIQQSLVNQGLARDS
jgi:acyl CoA:acetate/3-ketoacid CoA transferase alpha subunit